MDEINYEKMFAVLDGRYVMRDDCNDRHEKQNAKFAEMAIAQERIATKLDIICRVGIAILLALVSLIGTSLWNLIAK